MAGWWANHRCVLRKDERRSPSSEGKKLVVIVPAGTGTTALYLGRHLEKKTEGTASVVAVPCVGDAAHLRAQMEETEPVYRANPLPVRILEPKARKPFAKPRRSLLRMHAELEKETDLPFDLVYAPRAWEIVLEQLARQKTQDTLWAEDATILYLHCGGVEGNASQIARYRRSGLCKDSGGAD
jgi:1-aminocyclopropane-1-carboxylate deaminase